MQLKQIITLANESVKLRFLAMERSLRAVGCDLPLRVIPYDDRKFDLPGNATWWEMPGISAWVKKWGAHPTMRKYQCFTEGHYQFVDADVCFLRNPEEVLARHEGFVTSCGHWHNPAETVTEESRRYFAERSTTWQSRIFNTGQFACGPVLYSEEDVKAQAEKPEFRATCVELPHHEQPGINMLVIASGVEITNLTLPPSRMESTWAGDYGANFRDYWTDAERMPYIIHWAGVNGRTDLPVNEIFLSYLTAAERAEVGNQWKTKAEKKRREGQTLNKRVRKVGRAAKAFVNTLKG